MIRRALHLRSEMIAAQIRLQPHGATYQAIDDAMAMLHAMLQATSGRKLDYRKPDLGLF